MIDKKNEQCLNLAQIKAAIKKFDNLTKQIKESQTFEGIDKKYSDFLKFFETDIIAKRVIDGLDPETKKDYVKLLSQKSITYKIALINQPGNNFKLYFDSELSSFCTRIKNIFFDLESIAESQDHISSQQVNVCGDGNQVIVGNKINESPIDHKTDVKKEEPVLTLEHLSIPYTRNDSGIVAFESKNHSIKLVNIGKDYAKDIRVNYFDENSKNKSNYEDILHQAFLKSNLSSAPSSFYNIELISKELLRCNIQECLNKRDSYTGPKEMQINDFYNPVFIIINYSNRDDQQKVVYFYTSCILNLIKSEIELIFEMMTFEGFFHSIQERDLSALPKQHMSKISQLYFHIYLAIKHFEKDENSNKFLSLSREILDKKSKIQE